MPEFSESIYLNRKQNGDLICHTKPTYTVFCMLRIYNNLTVQQGWKKKASFTTCCLTKYYAAVMDALSRDIMLPLFLTFPPTNDNITDIKTQGMS